MKKKRFLNSGIFFAAFVILMIMLKTVDVGSAGPINTVVGFSHLNGWFNSLTGEHEILYKITEVLGIVILLIASAFAVLGLCQLIKRKSLLKVDIAILTLGGLYVIIGLIYVVFNKIVINCRPIMEWGESELDASFPSSHTILSCVVLGSTIMIIDRYIKNERISYWIKIICILMIAGTVIGRLISGAHWLTDIIAAILLSISLLSAYKEVTMIAEKKGRNGRHGRLSEN